MFCGGNLMTISEKRLFLCVFWYCSSNIAFSRTGAHKWIEKQLTEIEDMIAIYYNYTDKTNPGDNSPRDLSYWLGSDSSVIPGSADCSGSDSSVILGSTIATRKSKFGGFMMGSRAKARYFSSDRKIPSQNSLLVTKKFDWVLCGGDGKSPPKPRRRGPLGGASGCALARTTRGKDVSSSFLSFGARSSRLSHQ